MAPHYTDANFTGDQGETFIAGICQRSNALYRKWDKDIGIDCSIEFLNNANETMGMLTLVQVKSGSSFVTPNGRYMLKADKRHFEAWSRYLHYSLPVLGVVYNPATEDARWVNIADHLRAHPNSIETGPYSIEAPINQPFSADGFEAIRSSISATHSSMAVFSAQSLIDSYFSGDRDTRYTCVFSLYSRYQWTPVGCFFLHQVLRVEEDPLVIALLTDLIAFDWRYSYAGSTERTAAVPQPVREAVYELASKCVAQYGELEVAKLLSAIDEENGVSGGLGRLVVELLLRIPHVDAKLRLIATDRLIDPILRGYAVLILIADLYYANARFYRAALKTEEDLFVIEALSYALDSISEAHDKRGFLS